jgi:hypothetical protein
MTCECGDHCCPMHRGKDCHRSATTLLYRVDMEDCTGTYFCDDCDGEAYGSGLFTEARI